MKAKKKKENVARNNCALEEKNMILTNQVRPRQIGHLGDTTVEMCSIYGGTTTRGEGLKTGVV